VHTTHETGDERFEGATPDDLLARPDVAFDRIAALAARLFDVPIAILNLVDEDRIWLRSGDGLGSADSTRDRGIGAIAVVRTGPGLLADLPFDPRAIADPVLAGELGFRFYASVSLASSDGHGLGTLCIVDRVPRTLTPDEGATLEDLAAVVVDELELRLASRRISERERTFADEQRRSAEGILRVTSSIRELSESEDPDSVRPGVCRIAMELAQADSAAILDLAPDDATLTQTLNVGAPWISPDTRLSNLSSPAARAFITGKPVLVNDEPSGASDAGELATPPVTFWQPFPAGGRTSAAVLALSWEHPFDIAPIRVANLMDHLAAEAMAAFERADLVTQLEALARTDALTGLPNRRAINEDLPRELERARREGRSLCVALLDIDHFKVFNDTHGHPAGDRLLVGAASTWRDALRGGTDLLARYGGEEFLVVLPADPADAFATLERLRASMPEAQTASVGLAVWDGVQSADELVARADIALYAAKSAGRDRIAQAPTSAEGARRAEALRVVEPHNDS
jgi:diguanylate cyclase (GGDEF)-like protein